MTPAESAQEPERPFWNYEDVALFTGLAVPTMLVAFVILKLLMHVSPFLKIGKEPEALVGQFIWYVLLFSGLYALLHLRYRRPFWLSMGWTYPQPALLLSVPGGIALAFLLAALGSLMHAQEIQLPFDEFLLSRFSILMLGLFVVVLGPLCEELAFRGLILPLVTRSLGAVSGVLLTALPFALLHGPQYNWSWQHLALILTAGCVFGWTRLKTGSTAVATVLHASYNLTFFAGFLLQSKLTPTQW